MYTELTKPQSSSELQWSMNFSMAQRCRFVSFLSFCLSTFGLPLPRIELPATEKFSVPSQERCKDSKSSFKYQTETPVRSYTVFRLKFSFRFWLVYYICDPRKYKAIVTLDWWSILTTKNILRTTRTFHSKVREHWRINFLFEFLGTTVLA